MPKVSVIINCRNGMPFVQEALASVALQSYADWEIVFWDDRSSDGTDRVARAFGPRLRYFRSDDAVPVGTSRNRAVAMAQAPFLAFLDADDVWLPEHLARLVPLLESDPGCALVWADAWHIREDGKRLGRFSSTLQFRRGRRLRELYREGFVAPGSTTILRAECLAQVGGFPPDLHICSEMEAFLRLAAHWRLDFSAVPSALYRHHGNNISANGLAMNREEQLILDRWSQAPDHLGLRSTDFAFHRFRLAIKNAQLHRHIGAYPQALGALGAAATCALRFPSVLGRAAQWCWRRRQRAPRALDTSAPTSTSSP